MRLCPSVGPESILPSHSLPEVLLLLWGTVGCHSVAVGRERGCRSPLAVLAAVGWLLWLLVVSWDHHCLWGWLGSGLGTCPLSHGSL